MPGAAHHRRFIRAKSQDYQVKKDCNMPLSREIQRQGFNETDIAFLIGPRHHVVDHPL